MESFFKEGIAKLLSSGRVDDRDHTSSALPAYKGELSQEHFQTSEGVPLGIGAILPQTLAYEPQTQLIAFCTIEREVRLFGQELELCLADPSTSIDAQFLLFPRPGLLLLLGIATAVRDPATTRGGSAAAHWVAQWWDLSSIADRTKGSSNGSRIWRPQTVTLRFGATCVAASVEAALVFVATDEGDVRVFDAGEKPHWTGYCVPWTKLQSHRGQHVEAPPCPVTALAPALSGSTELLIGTAEGGMYLWSCERHRGLCTYCLSAAVCSLLWHQSGDNFLAASRTHITVFAKARSEALVQVQMPGGYANHVVLLHWNSEIRIGASKTPELGLGEILLRRGAPDPSILYLWGQNLAQSKNIFEDEARPILGAAVCLPSGATQPLTNTQDPQGMESGLPCGCMVPPLDAHSISGSHAGTYTQCQSALGRLAAAPLVLAVIGDPARHLVLHTAPPRQPMGWFASWGSLELANATSMQLVPRCGRDVASTRKVLTASPSQPLPPPPPPPPPPPEEPTQPPARAGLQEGVLVGGAQALPEGATDTEPMDGWLICEALVEAAASQGSGEDGEQQEEEENPSVVGVCCPWPAEGSVGVMMTCEMSLGLDASMELFVQSKTGKDSVVFDSSDQSVSLTGPLLEAGGSDSRIQAGLEPGQNHAVAVKLRTEGLEIVLDGTTLLGPVPGLWAPSSVDWVSRAGELRLRNIVTTVEEVPPQPPQQSEVPPQPPQQSEVLPQPAEQLPLPHPLTTGTAATHCRSLPPLDELAEGMFACRYAHFTSFVVGAKDALEPEVSRFVDGWCTMTGGWQGLLCSGHDDGTVRLWLRSHSSLLLLHTLSVRSLIPLPWRPRFDLTGQSWPPTRIYDGVDACPSVSAAYESGVAEPMSQRITSVLFEPAHGAVVAGTASGSVVLFIWSSEPQQLSVAEVAELEAHRLVSTASVPVEHSIPRENEDGSPNMGCTDGEHDSTDQMENSGDTGSCGVDHSHRLPLGFACVSRHRRHSAPVTLVRLVFSKDERLLVISADKSSGLSVMDGLSGEVLLSELLTDASAVVPTQSGPQLIAPVTISALTFTDCLLQMAASSPTSAPHIASVASPEDPREHGTQDCSGIGGCVLALSNGELRQLLLPEMKLLDTRIRETRLPQLPKDVVIDIYSSLTFLLVVQPTRATLCKRRANIIAEPPYWTTFSQRALSASTIIVAGELCLVVLLETLALQVFALPSLHQIAVLGLLEGGCVKGSRMQPSQTQQEQHLSCSFGMDGYLMMGSGHTTEVGRLSLSSCLAAAGTLDEVARAVTLARIAQALPHGPRIGADSQQSQTPKAGGGIFKAAASLLGGGGNKSLRSCTTAQGLPPEIDAARLDNCRGLPPAWQPLQATQKSAATPVQAAGSRDSRGPSFTTGAQAAMHEANQRAHERGEKLSHLGAKSQKMADDASNFANLAKQLNAQQQRSWF